MIRDAIEQAVREALGTLGFVDIPFVVERPGDMTHGDYATNVALVAGKLLKKNPHEVAEELVKILREALLNRDSLLPQEQKLPPEKVLGTPPPPLNAGAGPEHFNE